MNYDNFFKWTVQQVISTLPPSSANVMDNALYNSKEQNKVPGRSANKQTMVEWLRLSGFLAVCL
jgi:hypothetical protein